MVNSVEGKVDGTASVITGGHGNTIQTNNYASAIGGGTGNTIRTNGQRCVIAGGSANTILTDAYASSIVGGANNSAGGNYSLAAGYRAKASHSGCFVWGDSSVEADIASTDTNQFIVRAKGGIWFGTNSSPSFSSTKFIDTSTAGFLSSGGVWTDNSDRDAKENFKPVNDRDILKRVVVLPVQTWNYKAENKSIRHIGPVAQDFAAAFRVGTDDKHISALDGNGVALVAIKALYEMAQEKDAEIAKLKKQLAIVEKQLAVQQEVSAHWASRLGALEKAVSSQCHNSDGETLVVNNRK